MLLDSPFSVAESTELPRDRAPGTFSRPALLFHPVTGELMLCGLVGRLSLLSNECALRSSCDGCLECVGETSSLFEDAAGLLLSWMSPRGTESPMVGSLVADVSMVMVGARGLEGPLLVSLSAMVGA